MDIAEMKEKVCQLRQDMKRVNSYAQGNDCFSFHLCLETTTRHLYCYSSSQAQLFFLPATVYLVMQKKKHRCGN